MNFVCYKPGWGPNDQGTSTLPPLPTSLGETTDFKTVEKPIERKEVMGLITDFFVATPQEVEATALWDFPIGSMLKARGVETIGLDIFARLLLGPALKEKLRNKLLIHVKPDYRGLSYSEFGELGDPNEVIAFLRKNYTEEELDQKFGYRSEELDEIIQKMEGGELSELVHSGPSIEQFQAAFVEALASCSPGQLREIAPQWTQEWAEALENPSLLEMDALWFLQELAKLAQQALSERKPMYYFFYL
jgi:hypothetical protein